MDGLTNPAKWLNQVKFIQTNGLGKASCESDWDWYPPPLSDFDLWYALSGKGEMRINGEDFLIQKGSCFLVRPKDQPQAEQDITDPLRVIFIHFNCSPPEALHSYAEFLPNRFTRIIETFHFEALLNRILEIDTRQSSFKEEEFDFIMKQLFIQLYREQSEQQQLDPLMIKHKQLVQHIIPYIKEAHGHDVSYEELSELVGLSPTYFRKIFKKVMGISLKQYTHDLRLQRAMHLLQETSMNVSQVAETIGYANIYFFSKQFKQYFGYPPSDFKYKWVADQPHGRKK